MLALVVCMLVGFAQGHEKAFAAQGPSDAQAHEQQVAETSVEQSEALADALKHMLRVDEIAAGDKHVKNQTKALDDELSALEKSLQVLQNTSATSETPLDVNEIRAGAAQTFKFLRQHAKRSQVRDVAEQARGVARGLQSMARKMAREARTRTDKLEREYGSDNGFAENLQRRAEKAASLSERRGEALARRVEDELHDEIMIAEVESQQPDGHAHFAWAAVLGLRPEVGVVALLAALVSVGVFGAVALRRRSAKQRAVVAMPTDMLG
mmetsp:Transcript_31193/g.85531  ORF Transcript_31193/g.85531 Transcript_31193/m.85531 type:complete len:267 (+) Transcript_31193:114-914(+)